MRIQSSILLLQGCPKAKIANRNRLNEIFANSTNLKRRERSFRRQVDEYGRGSSKGRATINKKQTVKNSEMGYNSLLFNEHLSIMEKDLEYERKTIEKREEILSNLELQLTSKDGDENQFFNEQNSPRRATSRRRKYESPKVKFNMSSEKKPAQSRRLFNYPIKNNDNNTINQNIRRKKARKRHLRN
mmetsp:Transcript_32300/g.28609  ORF Transcript_32300/g.28609 Transcript_32300/m.28609 type:complete len:187 (-) Transcript_32300:591-1151(-)